MRTFKGKNMNQFKMLITTMVISLSSSMVVHAAPPVNIAKVPLNATVSTAPNVMYILDDSGSMDRTYLPDWAGGGNCRTSSGTTYTNSCDVYPISTSLGTANAFNGLPLVRSSDFNGIYYNPAIRYVAPKNADGTNRPDQVSPWTSVKVDAYNIQSTASTNLITGFPDTEWCTNTSYTDCMRNDNYILPSNEALGTARPQVDGKSYTVAHVIASTGTGRVATGSRANPTFETREFGPFYYDIVPGEFCATADLKDCRSTLQTGYTIPAKVRWCNNNTNATAVPESVSVNACQATRKTGFTVARYPTKFFKSTVTPGSTSQTGEVLWYPATPQIGTAAVAPVAAQPERAAFAQFNLVLGGDCEGSRRARLRQVRVNGGNIMPTQTGATLDVNTLATEVRTNINSAPSPRPYAASGSGATIRLTANTSAGNITYPVSIQLGIGSCSVTLSPTNPTFSGYAAAVPASPGIPASPGYQPATPATCGSPVTLSGLSGPNSYGHVNGQRVCQYFTTTGTSTAYEYYGSFKRVDIVPSNNSYPKAAGREDCTGTTCTYNQEMTNFANWYTYYRSRMQAMKTSTSLAFAEVTDKTRVGFSTINDTAATNSSTFLTISEFSSSQKSNWFNVLFNSAPDAATPLRSALSQAGRIYAGKVGTDPVQYACQANYALLTTDGYWNGDAGVDVDGGAMGGRDHLATVPRPKRDSLSISDTLSDVSYYYAHTDLRTPLMGNCTGSVSANVCQDGTAGSVNQFMNTFTLGLGVDGALRYAKDYKTGGSSDYNAVVTGAANWPSPNAGDDEKIDDLWHAAVNGNGTYFSAKNPQDVKQGLLDALTSIGTATQAGNSAALSTALPVPGNNYSYIATFTSDQWTGNIQKRQLVVSGTTANFSNTIENCVEDILADAPTSACIGINTTAPKVSAVSDTRTIYINGGGTLVPFTYSNLPTSMKPYFEDTFLSTRLSQWSLLTPSQQTSAAGDGLVNFLRGRTGFEDRTINSLPVDNRLFRLRKATLGDITDSKVVYVNEPGLDYIDAGYAAYKASQVGRTPMLLVGANDGMLHSFNTTNLAENWSFIPTAVMPKLWSLADKQYTHENFVNGTVTIAHVSNGGVWKTIAVGGFNAGARGYYALDITNPTTPVLLWEFTDANMGYSFGKPVVTKDISGNWVVLVTSGYNNRPDFLQSSGDGQGHLYVLNAHTGSLVREFSTGVGSAANPSGLAQINTFVKDATVNNISSYAYGGDLEGNLWRFDIGGSSSPFLLARLRDGGSLAQPITTAPMLSEVDGKRLVIVGTGKYLESDDRSTEQTQTIYAIRDNDLTTTVSNPRSSLVQQTLTTSTASSRTGSNNTVDYATRLGWFVDLPDPGERQVINADLFSGTLNVVTAVPKGSDCNPSGYSWKNQINYETGAVAVSTKVAGTVGMVTVDLSGLGLNGPYSLGTPSNLKTGASLDKIEPTVSGEFQSRRSIWRELLR